MYKTDGLVWPRNHDGWKTIPVGACTVHIPDMQSFLRSEACVRYEVEELEPAATCADLLSRYPEQPDARPTIVRAVVFPSNLDTIVCVWNRPVVPRRMALPELSNAGLSFDGRLMFVQAAPVVGTVSLDVANVGTLNINANRFVAYHPVSYEEPEVPTDEYSDPAALQHATNDAISVPIVLAKRYAVMNVNQPSGKPHEVWGASYCLRGMISPFPLIPYGQYITFASDTLSPPNGMYVGVVGLIGVSSTTGYIVRGTQFQLTVIGAGSSGRVTLDAVNDSGALLVPGETVRFASYRESACNVSNVVKFHNVSASIPKALQMIDDAIIKPRVRTLYMTSSTVFITQFRPYAYSTVLVVCSGLSTSTITVLTSLSVSTITSTLRLQSVALDGFMSRTSAIYFSSSVSSCDTRLQLFSGSVVMSGEGVNPYNSTTYYTILSPVLAAGTGIPRSSAEQCGCLAAPEPISIDASASLGSVDVCTIPLRRPQQRRCIYGTAW